MLRVLLTGGPGAGKTTVLEVLRDLGHAVGDDAAREIIRARIAQGLSPRPDPASFAKEILAREIDAYSAVVTSPKFFERGVADVAASLLGAGAIDEDGARKLVESYPYFHRVFLFPPWQAIYRVDRERDHPFEHAVKVYKDISRWYARFDYEMIDVPFDSAESRAQFILEKIDGA